MDRRYFTIIVIFSCYFSIGFITNVISPLIPDIIHSFSLSLTLVSLLPFAIFLAYGLFSIPAGLGVERFGEKTLLIAAFVLTLFSSLLITLFPGYAVSVISLFTIGMGLAIMQVSLNPLLRETGGEEHYSVNLAIVQLVFGGAAYVSPFIYSYLATRMHRPESGEASNGVLLRLFEAITRPGLSWVSMYSIFALVSLIMLVLIVFTRIPKVELSGEERIENASAFRSLLKNRQVWLFIIGQFLYVGLEVGIVTWISQFLLEYRGFDPHTTGAKTVAWFWGAFTVGNLIAILLLKLFDSRHVLIGASVIAAAALGIALFLPGTAAIAGFILLGVGISPLWPVIYSLALNSVPEHHGALSGMLVTATAGGAAVPLIIGGIGDLLGLRAGMFILFGCLIYIGTIGCWAKPLVSNKRFRDKAGCRSQPG